MVQRHVLKAFFLAVGARSEILVDGGNVALLLARDTRWPMKKAGRCHEIVVEPHITQLAVGIVAFEAVVAALELQPNLFLHGSGASVAQARWQLLLPQVARFHHMVIDGDDQRKVFFGRCHVAHGWKRSS